MKALIAVFALATSALSVAVIALGFTLWGSFSLSAAKDAELVELRKNRKAYEDFVAVVKERCECEKSQPDRGNGRGESNRGSVGALP